MTRKQALENAIRTIAGLRGPGNESLFAVTPVSRDPGGVVIMAVRWPEGARLYREMKRVVRGFPDIVDASCVALLPEVVDEIIAAARTGSADCGDDDGEQRVERRTAKGAEETTAV